MDYKIDLPKQVEWIIHKIEEHGFEAYAVGGCIRDSILGRIPNDWDITTSAKPEKIKQIFKKTIDTGIQHGTVTVMVEKEGYEITTYRIDGEYEDNRHPKEVNFTSDLLEDLKRRDFTINAMAYNDKNGLVDAFEGLKDIQNKVIRCVGDPIERFSEDALRMMRAVRFSAQLGYSIDENTKKAINTLADRISYVSAERIQVELVKLLTSDHPDYLRVAYETGITKRILEEFDICMQTPQNNKHHRYDVGEHILHSMCACECEKNIRLAMLFHDIGKPQTLQIDKDGVTHNYGHAKVGYEMTKKILKRLRFDNDTMQKVSQLVLYHDMNIENTDKSVRKAVSKVGKDLFWDLLKVKKADIAAQSDYKLEEKREHIFHIEECFRNILERKDPISLKDLAVSGKDLLEAGVNPGKEVGEKLEYLLQHVLSAPEDNQKEILLKILMHK